MPLFLLAPNAPTVNKVCPWRAITIRNSWPCRRRRVALPLLPSLLSSPHADTHAHATWFNFGAADDERRRRRRKLIKFSPSNNYRPTRQRERLTLFQLGVYVSCPISVFRKGKMTRIKPTIFSFNGQLDFMLDLSGACEEARARVQSSD